MISMFALRPDAREFTPSGGAALAAVPVDVHQTGTGTVAIDSQSPSQLDLMSVGSGAPNAVAMYGVTETDFVGGRGSRSNGATWNQSTSLNPDAPPFIPITAASSAASFPYVGGPAPAMPITGPQPGGPPASHGLPRGTHPALGRPSMGGGPIGQQNLMGSQGASMYHSNSHEMKQGSMSRGGLPDSPTMVGGPDESLSGGPMNSSVVPWTVPGAPFYVGGPAMTPHMPNGLVPMYGPPGTFMPQNPAAGYLPASDLQPPPPQVQQQVHVPPGPIGGGQRDYGYAGAGRGAPFPGGRITGGNFENLGRGRGRGGRGRGSYGDGQQRAPRRRDSGGGERPFRPVERQGPPVEAPAAEPPVEAPAIEPTPAPPTRPTQTWAQVLKNSTSSSAPPSVAPVARGYPRDQRQQQRPPHDQPTILQKQGPSVGGGQETRAIQEPKQSTNARRPRGKEQHAVSSTPGQPVQVVTEVVVPGTVVDAGGNWKPEVTQPQTAQAPGSQPPPTRGQAQVSQPQVQAQGVQTTQGGQPQQTQQPRQPQHAQRPQQLPHLPQASQASPPTPSQRSIEQASEAHKPVIGESTPISSATQAAQPGRQTKVPRATGNDAFAQQATQPATQVTQVMERVTERIVERTERVTERITWQPKETSVTTGSVTKTATDNVPQRREAATPAGRRDQQTWAAVTSRRRAKVENAPLLPKAASGVIFGGSFSHDSSEFDTSRCDHRSSFVVGGDDSNRATPGGTGGKPAVEMPEVEMPAVEMPAVEMPAVEMPVVEMPAVEMPPVEMPAVEMPAVEMPAVEMAAGLCLEEIAETITETRVEPSVEVEKVSITTFERQPDVHEAERTGVPEVLVEGSGETLQEAASVSTPLTGAVGGSASFSPENVEEQREVIPPTTQRATPPTSVEAESVVEQAEIEPRPEQPPVAVEGTSIEMTATVELETPTEVVDDGAPAIVEETTKPEVVSPPIRRDEVVEEVVEEIVEKEPEAAVVEQLVTRDSEMEQAVNGVCSGDSPEARSDEVAVKGAILEGELTETRIMDEGEQPKVESLVQEKGPEATVDLSPSKRVLTPPDNHKYSIEYLLLIRKICPPESGKTLPGLYSVPYVMTRKTDHASRSMRIPDEIRRRPHHDSQQSVEDVWRINKGSGAGTSPMTGRSMLGGPLGKLAAPPQRGRHAKPLVEAGGSFRSNSREGDDTDMWRLGSRPAAPLARENPLLARSREVTDRSAILERKLIGLLNKLTIEKFDALYAEIKNAGLQDDADVTKLMEHICLKAKTQHHFIPMYVRLCCGLNADLADVVSNGSQGFRRLLVDACQKSFDESLQPIVIPEQLNEDEQFEYLLKEKKKIKGNIIFIGELLKEKMLAAKVIKGCIQVLLTSRGEAQLEALCELLYTTGHIMCSKFKNEMNLQMSQIEGLTNDSSLTIRMRCLLKDVVDDWKAGWQKGSQIRSGGPMTLDEIHKKMEEEEREKSYGKSDHYGSQRSYHRETHDDFTVVKRGKPRAGGRDMGGPPPRLLRRGDDDRCERAGRDRLDRVGVPKASLDMFSTPETSQLLSRPIAVEHRASTTAPKAAEKSSEKPRRESFDISDARNRLAAWKESLISAAPPSDIAITDTLESVQEYWASNERIDSPVMTASFLSIMADARTSEQSILAKFLGEWVVRTIITGDDFASGFRLFLKESFADAREDCPLFGRVLLGILNDLMKGGHLADALANTLVEDVKKAEGEDD